MCARATHRAYFAPHDSFVNGRPWAKDLHERLWITGHGRPHFGLPRPSSRASHRPATAAQAKRLRADWLGLHVQLYDFADRPRCSRSIAVRRACTLDDLSVLLCAAVGRSDTEHLYYYDTDRGRYSHPFLAGTDGSTATVGVTLSELGLRSGQRLLHVYDMGDYWQDHCRVQSIPREKLGALRAHAADRARAPGFELARTGRAPRQYPKSDF